MTERKGGINVAWPGQVRLISPVQRSECGAWGQPGVSIKLHGRFELDGSDLNYFNGGRARQRCPLDPVSVQGQFNRY